MRSRSMPTVMGVVMLVAGIAAGVFLVQNKQIFKLKAKPETVPENIRISNITDTSFNVSWTTNGQTNGFVSWSESESGAKKTTSEDAINKSHTHTVTVHELTPSTEYFYTINSGGDEYNNSGIPWTIMTGPVLTRGESTEPISGSVLSLSGDPEQNALIYLTIGGAELLSATTSKSGNWVIPISSLRTQDLSNYYKVDEKLTPLEITVQAGVAGVSSAQAFPYTARPVPPMVLGESYDFRSKESGEQLESPEANIELPEDTIKGSKFDLNDESQTNVTAKVVTLESLDDGEVVTTTSPEFFGDGPAGTVITITVQSDPITDNVVVGSNGNWDWSPPADLEEGVHELTLSWRDENGILRTISRSFEVQAADSPAFEATPSKPTATPVPTSSPVATLKPTIAPSPKPSPLPDAGTLTPTIALTIMGLGIIMASGLVSILAFRKD